MIVQMVYIKLLYGVLIDFFECVFYSNENIPSDYLKIKMLYE